MKILKNAIRKSILKYVNKPWKFFSLDDTEEVPDGEVVSLKVEKQLVPINRGHLQHLQI